MKTLLIILLTTIGYCASGQLSKAYLFVGTYTDGKPDKGIYIFEFNSESVILK